MSKVIDTERRLVAIFAADVEGYSHLMDTDEVGTMRDLNQRRTILDGLIAAHRGRIANTAGDSVLAEFGSAVDAVQCAVEAQEALAQANAEASPDHHINFRIGVHVGDVMVKGGDLFGDSVNIAARLQNIASAGGTCISGMAHDQVRKILPFSFTDLGAHQLKNIEEPVRAFAVSAKAGSDKTRYAPASIPIPLPDKPSIAVLPFQNLSSDPEQAYFAEGLTANLTTDLSRITGLFVIASTTAAALGAKIVDVRMIGRDLGVRYVLQGGVQRVGNRVRVNAQMLDTSTGAQLWSDRFDGNEADLFEMQDQIISRIANSIGREIVRVPRRGFRRQAPNVR
ncbi:MAG: hypothetical protein NVSMB6_30010 [Burkholderiaceae bacterium]